MRRVLSALSALCVVVLAATCLGAEEGATAEQLHAPRVLGAGRHAVEVRTVRMPGSGRIVRSLRPPGAAAPVLRMAGDRLLVRFDPGMQPAQQAASVAGQGMRLDRRIGAAMATIAFPVRDAGSFDAAREQLLRMPGVLACEPDLIVSVDREADDPRFGEQWSLRNTAPGGYGTPGADVRAVGAWDVTTGSRDILVGVIDTGIDRTHPDLAANMWENAGETGTDGSGADRRSNGVDDDGNGFVDDWRGWDFVDNDNDPHDLHGHGTHCAGIIGASGDDGYGIAGVSWNVSLVGLRFLDAYGYGSLSGAIAALDYSRRIGCRVTSNSWGASGTSAELEAAIRATAAAGQLFVCAAGNSSLDVDVGSVLPAGCDASNIIAVMSTDRWDSRSYFSNYGANLVHLAAPGSEILSTVPGGYDVYSGTSMAAPHVTGAAVLAWAADPAASADGIRARILSGVRAAGMACATGGILDCAAAVRAVPGSEPVVASSSFVRDGVRVTFASSGQDVVVDARVVNIGRTAASDVTVLLEEADGASTVEILRGSAALGGLAASAWVQTGDALAIRVPASYAGSGTVTLSMSVLQAGLVQQVRRLRLPIHTLASISGRVTYSADATPLPGVTVYAYGYSSGSYVSTLTSADGTYAFASLVDGMYQLQFVPATGYASTVVNVSLPPSQVVDVALDPAPFFQFSWANDVGVEQGQAASGPLTVTNIGRAAGMLRHSPEGIITESSGLWHMARGDDHDGDGLSFRYALRGTQTAATGTANSGTLRFRSWEDGWSTSYLTFWMRNDVPGEAGSCVCEVSGDDGASWYTLWYAPPGDGTWQQVQLYLPFYRSRQMQIRWRVDRVAASPGTAGSWSIDEMQLDTRFDAWSMTAWAWSDPDEVSLDPGESASLDLWRSGQALPAQWWTCYPRFTAAYTAYFPTVQWSVTAAPVIAVAGIALDGGEAGVPAGGGSVPVEIALANQGEAGATGVTVEVQAPGLVCTRATAGAFALPGGVSRVDTTWTVQAPLDYAGPAQAELTVTVRDDAGRSWQRAHMVQVVEAIHIAGRIVDARNGSPLAGASVQVGGTAVLSGEDGRFAIPCAAAGYYLVTITSPGFAQRVILASTGENGDLALESRRLQFLPDPLVVRVDPGQEALARLDIVQSGSQVATIHAVAWDSSAWLDVPEDILFGGSCVLGFSSVGLEVGAYATELEFRSDSTDAEVRRLPILFLVGVDNFAPIVHDLRVTVRAGGEIGIDCSARDAEGDVLSYSLTDSCRNGAVSGDLPRISYRPQAGFIGTDGFAIAVSDGWSSPVPMQVVIDVVSAEEAAEGGGGGCGVGASGLLLAAAGGLALGGRRRRRG